MSLNLSLSDSVWEIESFSDGFVVTHIESGVYMGTSPAVHICDAKARILKIINED